MRSEEASKTVMQTHEKTYGHGGRGSAIIRAAMKKGIHPKYEEATITCACGNVLHTRSTVKDMHVNTCSACHPYFTGQQTFVDTEGRIDSFRRRYANLKK